MWSRKLPGSLSLAWLSLPLSRLALCTVLLCGASSFCFSQSFDPKATYQVTGSELNQLERDLLTAQAELSTLETRNAQLVKDSESKEKALEGLKMQLQTVYQSWTESKAEARSRELWMVIGGSALIVVAYILGGVGK